MRLVLLSACIVLGLTAVLLADKVELNDGTTIEGTVLKLGDNYWVKIRTVRLSKRPRCS